MQIGQDLPAQLRLGRERHLLGHSGAGAGAEIGSSFAGQIRAGTHQRMPPSIRTDHDLGLPYSAGSPGGVIDLSDDVFGIRLFRSRRFSARIRKLLTVAGSWPLSFAEPIVDGRQPCSAGCLTAIL
jgi:hypothetical protein